VPGALTVTDAVLPPVTIPGPLQLNPVPGPPDVTVAVKTIEDASLQATAATEITGLASTVSVRLQLLEQPFASVIVRL